MDLALLEIGYKEAQHSPQHLLCLLWAAIWHYGRGDAQNAKLPVPRGPSPFVSQVRAFEFNRQISDFGLKTKHATTLATFIAHGGRLFKDTVALGLLLSFYLLIHSLCWHHCLVSVWVHQGGRDLCGCYRRLTHFTRVGASHEKYLVSSYLERRITRKWFPMDQPSGRPCSEAVGPCPTVVIISLRPYHT